MTQRVEEIRNLSATFSIIPADSLRLFFFFFFFFFLITPSRKNIINIINVVNIFIYKNGKKINNYNGEYGK